MHGGDPAGLIVPQHATVATKPVPHEKEEAMYHAIMVPLDGSSFGEHALPYAISIARHTGAQLHLAHVYDIPPPESGDSVDAELRAYEQAYVEGFVPRVQPHCQGPITTIQLDGPTAVELHDYAMAITADLVIMTTHGRGALSRLWLGSVADKLVRQLPMPVLLVRPHEPAPDFAHVPTFKHILIPLDGSALAEQILPHALALGRLAQAEFTLLQAIAPVIGAYSTELYGAGWSDQVLEQVRTNARAYLDGIAAPLRAKSLHVRTVVADTFPMTAILDYARAHAVDLIALATHGRSGVARWLLGGVADKVLRSAELPVLLYRPQESGEPR
jgi:nucleotide-binding universal stress UspA family protein